MTLCFRNSLLALTFITWANFSIALEKTSLSAEAFGALPEIMSVQISPDGSKILMLKNLESEITLITRALGDPTDESHVIPYEDGIYNWAVWGSNDRVLASVRFAGHEDRSSSLRLMQQRRLISMKWDGGDMFNVNRFPTGSRIAGRFTTRQPQYQDRIIDILKDDPEHILIQLDIETAGEPSVYKLNIESRRRTRVLKSRRTVDFWMTDHEHNVRYGEGSIEGRGNNDFRHVAFYRKEVGGQWITLFDYNEASEQRPFYFEGYSEDPNIIYITADDEEGFRSLYTFDVNSKERLEKIAGDGRRNIVDVAVNDDLELEYYAYNHEKPDVIRLTARGKKIDTIAAKHFPGLTVDEVSQSKDRQKIIVDVTSPTHPLAYYYIDLETGEVQKIGQAYAALDHERLSEKIPVTYQARDGLEINAYLSLPKGGSDKNLPTIILPHGGPMARDTWNFQYWTQFLTSRGFAVLQMNYRGSTGYGEAFRLLGYHEWGRKMLEDINDGTAWMIAQGYADPKRICMMGGSYGGYAALQSIVMAEHDYKCAIAFAPITHIPDLIDNFRGVVGYRSYRNYVESDDWSTEEASPSFNIDKINVPVLLIQGDRDLNVPRAQARDFNSRMQRAGKDIKYIELEGGDHFLSSQAQRSLFLKESEAFLKKHLK